jgi:hypothetical protein
MEYLFEILILVFITEALTELLTKSEFFYPFRKFLFKKRENKIFNFLHSLLDCGYCTSVWVGCFLGLLFFGKIVIIYKWVDWVIVGLFLHKASNILHNLIDLIYYKGKN